MFPSHLHTTSVTYNKNKNPRDSSALFEQKIPACYLELQTAIREVVAEYNKDEKAPILSEEEFRYLLVLVCHLCRQYGSCSVHVCLCWEWYL
jgi:hypothetical protein